MWRRRPWTRRWRELRPIWTGSTWTKNRCWTGLALKFLQVNMLTQLRADLYLSPEIQGWSWSLICKAFIHCLAKKKVMTKQRSHTITAFSFNDSTPSLWQCHRVTGCVSSHGCLRNEKLLTHHLGLVNLLAAVRPFFWPGSVSAGVLTQKIFYIWKNTIYFNNIQHIIVMFYLWLLL